MLIVIALGGTLCPCVGISADTVQTKRVLVLSNQAEQASMAALTTLLGAHLQDLNATVSLEVVEYSPRDIFEQVEKARALVQSRGAFSAIWVERSKDEVFLFVSDNANQNVFLQTFEGSEDGWAVECEAVAALVRSALITWLAVEPDTPVNDETETPPADGDKSEAAQPTSDSATGERGDADTAPVSFTAEAGYSPKMVSPGDHVTHNAALTVGVRLFDRVAIGVGASVGSSLKLDVAEHDLYFRNIPVFLRAGWIFHTGMVELGLGAAFVLDVTYLKERTTSRVPDDGHKNNPGLGIWGRIGIRPVRYVSIFASVGCDFFFENIHYMWGESAVLKYGAVQPVAVVGAEVVLGRVR